MQTISGHKGCVSSLAIQDWGVDEEEKEYRDGRRVHRLISASHDKTIKVWNINTQGDVIDDEKQILTLTGHKGKIRAMAVNTDPDAARNKYQLVTGFDIRGSKLLLSYWIFLAPIHISKYGT